MARLPERIGPGPWLSAFGFALPGQVRSKSNYRHSKRGSWGEVQSYEQAVHLTAKAARPAGWIRPDRDVPVDARPTVVAVLVGRTGLDAANLSKSVLDACEGAVYVKDSQVRGCVELAIPARTEQGLVVAFAQLPPDARLAELSVALRHLQAHLLEDERAV